AAGPPAAPGAPSRSAGSKRLAEGMDAPISESSDIRVTTDAARGTSRRDLRGGRVALAAVSKSVRRRDRRVRRRRGPPPGVQEGRARALHARGCRGLRGPGRSDLRRAGGGLQQPDRHPRAGRDLQRHDERHERAPAVAAGRTYVSVAGAYGGAQGTLSLPVTPPAGPVPTAPTTLPGGGACSSPTAIPAPGGTFSGTTSGTSALAGSCGSSGDS